jgi:hypothetical protein
MFLVLFPFLAQAKKVHINRTSHVVLQHSTNHMALAGTAHGGNKNRSHGPGVAVHQHSHQQKKAASRSGHPKQHNYGAEEMR